MKRNSLHRLVAATLVAAGGCAGIQVKPDSLANVKTVAVVNLTAHDQMSSGGTGGGNRVSGGLNAIRSLKKLGSGEAQAQYRARMESIYDLVTDKVATAGFATTKRAEVTGNEKFAEVYNRLTRINLTDDPGALCAKGGRLDLRRIGDRQQILTALGVDAVASAEVTFEVGKTGGASIGGFGALKRYPQARVTLVVYNGSDAEPIWADYRVVGAVASDGLQETMGLADTKDPGPIFVEATTTALDELVARFHKARNAPAK